MITKDVHEDQRLVSVWRYSERVNVPISSPFSRATTTPRTVWGDDRNVRVLSRDACARNARGRTPLVHRRSRGWPRLRPCRSSSQRRVRSPGRSAPTAPGTPEDSAMVPPGGGLLRDVACVKLSKAGCRRPGHEQYEVERSRSRATTRGPHGGLCYRGRFRSSPNGAAASESR